MSEQLSPIDVRRLFLEDYEWERTHQTWKSLKPNKNFNTWSPDDESPKEYFERINSEFDIPLEVIEQWLYPHFYNRQTTNNYGWINFSFIKFEKEQWPLERLTEVYVIEDYRDYVQMRARSRNFDDFMCIQSDLEYWKTNGTWRVPPIILDARNLQNIPQYSEIVPPYQLVEGHTRLGYLLAFSNFCQNTGDFIADRHEVYIMKPD